MLPLLGQPPQTMQPLCGLLQPIPGIGDGEKGNIQIACHDDAPTGLLNQGKSFKGLLVDLVQLSGVLVCQNQSAHDLERSKMISCLPAPLLRLTQSWDQK